MTLKISTDNIQTATLASLASVSIPKITSITYPGDDTAATTAGGQTITLTGSGFIAGASVIVNGSYAGVVTVVSNTSITFTTPANSGGTYPLYVVNTDGGTAISIPGISYSGTPSWSNTAGSLATVYETAALSTQLTATGNQGDGAITYSVYSGTLPPGSSLNTSTGLLSGTTQATASSTTYTFTIRASDEQNQDTDRAFSITINPDAVTWSSPADGTVTSLFQNQAMANVTLSATSAAGQSIAYTANALPTGVTISGSNVTGTPTVVGNTISVITATAANTNRTATRTFTWVVSVSSDSYFKNTTLLLNGETTVTPFISDASANSLALTINGDTKPVLFNPYQGDGYYGAYLNGSSYMTFPNNSAFAFGTGAFTIEFWVNFSLQSDKFFLGGRGAIGTMHITTGGVSTSTTPGALRYVGSSTVTSGSTVITDNAWHHCAIVRDGSTNITVYVDGVSRGTGTDSTNYTTTSGDWWFASNDSGGPSNIPTGYISNFRIVKGTAVYTSAFTPSTTPLTAIANTSILLCQSNRFIDKSTNAFSLTVTGLQISPAIPFTANSNYSTYGSAYFDGTGDYLRVPYNAGFAMGSSNFTIEYWVYPTVLTGDITVLGAHTNDTNGGYAAGFNGTQPRTWINIGGGGANWYQVTGPTALLNTWNHIALVRNGSSFYMYTNGVQGTVYTNGGAISDASNSDVTIGARYNGTGNFYTGYVTDARIVKGTAVYTSAFTPPTSPLTAIANTSLLTLQYNGGATNQAIIDNSNFNNIITRNGNTSQGTFSPYSVTGWSNYFNGTSDYWTVASNTAFQFGTGDFTIECWVYPIPNGLNYPTFLSSVTGWSAGASGHRFNNTGYANKFWFGLNGSGGVASGDPFMASTNTFTPNLWHHYALTRSGNTWRMFVNGALENTQTYSGSYDAGYGGLRSGWSTWDGAAGYFTGYTSNLRIIKGTALYTSAFTPSTTPLTPITNTSLLTSQSNKFIDNGPNNFTITPAGTVNIQAFGPFGSVPEAVPISYSNYFDGTGDYLQLVDNVAVDLGTGNFTIEFWFMRTATPTVTYHGIVGGNGSGFNAWSIYYTNGNEIMVFNSAGVIQTTTGASISNNIWYHVAVVKNTGVLKVYVNGVERYSASDANAYNITANGWRIGDDGSHANGWMNGYISNLRIVKGTAVYTSAFTPSTTPLTAIANTSLLTCQSTTMIDNSTNNFTLTATGDTKPRIFNPFGYTAQSATSYTPTIHGGSVYFDGTGDYLRYNNTSIMTFSGSSTFTVECWTYQTAYTSTSGYMNTIIGDLTPTDATALYWSVGMNASNQPGVRWFDGTVKTADSGTALPLNTWNHVAWVVTSGVVTIFVNGVKSTLTGTTTLTTPSSTVGYYITGADRGTYFTGSMSDLRITRSAIYTSNFVPPAQALSNYSTTYPASLLLNFTNGGIIDQHSTNVLENVNGPQLSTSVKKYNNGSLSFSSASTQYLFMSGKMNAFQFQGGDFTIELWVNISDTSARKYILGPGTDTASHYKGFGLEIWGQQLCMWASSNGSSWDLLECDTAGNRGSTLLSSGTWYHIAVTRNGNVYRSFINGTVEKTFTVSGSIYFDATIPYNIGRTAYQSGNFYFNGYMDDLRITKGYARYTANFTAPTSTLTTK